MRPGVKLPSPPFKAGGLMLLSPRLRAKMRRAAEELVEKMRLEGMLPHVKAVVLFGSSVSPRWQSKGSDVDLIVRHARELESRKERKFGAGPASWPTK